MTITKTHVSVAVSSGSIAFMEWLERTEIDRLISFGLETMIGVCTLIYMILKIKSHFKQSKNESN